MSLWMFASVFIFFFPAVGFGQTAEGEKQRQMAVEMRRKLEDNNHSMAAQNRFIAEQEEEKKRVNARFDEERARLKSLWGPAPSAATAGAAAPR